MSVLDELFGLEGKVALVTGAANGIGAGTAALFARCGALLCLCDRVETDDFSAGPDVDPDVLRCLLDVRDVDAVGAMVTQAVERFGRIDVLVNNAGGTFAAPLSDVSAKGENALIAENFTQVTHLIRAVVPVMAAGSSIVNVTSIEAHRAAPGFAVYAAMKAAVENLTKTMALELAPRGIRVNAVAPDALSGTGADEVGEQFETSPIPYELGHRTPLGFPGDPTDAAAAILYLASAASRFVTGATIAVDGGNAAAGGWRRVMDA